MSFRPRWADLRVELNGRLALYAESFPGVLEKQPDSVIEWFSHENAVAVLETFAGAWQALGRDDDNESVRFLYVPFTSDTGIRFRAVALGHDAVVVAEILAI